MIGLLYPGVSRLDYDAGVDEGRFPAHVESNCDPEIARWVERVISLVPINQRPAGYSPLGIRNLDPAWIAQLGRTGKDCFDAILNKMCIRDRGYPVPDFLRRKSNTLRYGSSAKRRYRPLAVLLWKIYSLVSLSLIHILLRAAGPIRP